MSVKFLDLKKINASFQPSLDRAMLDAVHSGWYLLGKEIQEFEKEYSSYIGTDHCVCCANGLDALTLIFRAYVELGRMKPGDEVIVAANTFFATFLAITEAGLIPVPVDADADTLQINPTLLETALTSKTRALAIVHLYGQCAYTEKIGEFCKEHDLILVEDNAQAAGCRFNGRKTGSLGDAAGHSFYPGKNLGALGDGGAVTTNDAGLAKMIRTLAFYGSEKRYVFDYCGRNSRLDEIQAAALRVKLPRLDEDNNRRKEIARRYKNEIDNPYIRVPFPITEDETEGNVFHLFPVLTPHRDRLQKYLEEREIQTIIHYPIPPHLQKCYADSSLQSVSLPITEQIANEELSIPISPVMTEGEVNEVIAALNEFEP